MNNVVTLRWAILPAALALSIFSFVGIANTQVVIPVAQDNTLYEDSTGTLSNGVGETLRAGRTNQSVGSIRRGLIAFDLDQQVPPDTCTYEVSNPRLTMHVSQVAGSAVNVSLHRLLQDWGEGTSDAPGTEGQGTPAEADDATWLHTYFDTAFWSLPGGNFDGTPSATIAIGDTGYYTWGPTPKMVDDLKFWQIHPDSSFGWIVIGDESASGTAIRFSSHDHVDLALRPELDVIVVIVDCLCPNQGDFNSDIVHDAVDLNLLIDALFFGSSSNPQDPSCPVKRGDLDCSGVTDAVDLNVMIDFLFFGGVEPCDPCCE